MLGYEEVVDESSPLPLPHLWRSSDLGALGEFFFLAAEATSVFPLWKVSPVGPGPKGFSSSPFIVYVSLSTNGV